MSSNQFNLISGNGINQNGDGMIERFQFDGLLQTIILLQKNMESRLLMSVKGYRNADKLRYSNKATFI